MFRRASKDDRGVTALEYAVITGFLAAMLFPPAMIAATRLFGGGFTAMGSSSSVVGRGPYNFPDGPVLNSNMNVSTMSGLNNLGYPYFTYALIAKNGNLFVQAAAMDLSNNAVAPYQTIPFIPGATQSIFIPQNGATVFLSGQIPGGIAPGATLSPSAMNAYPRYTGPWYCGC